MSSPDQSTAVTRVNIRCVPARQSNFKGVGRSIITPVHGITGGHSVAEGGSTSGLSPGSSWAIVVEVEDHDGRRGLGTAGFGHPSVIAVIEQLAHTVVLGAQPARRNHLWELMHRSTINIGRHGIAVHAISALDIALWDLFGHQTNQPVHALLGGAVQHTIPAYASWLYGTEDLDQLASEASSYVAQGYQAVKQRMAYGPLDGPTGMAKNLELVKTVSKAIGPNTDHMIDAYMGWDLPYATRMIRAIEDAGIRLRWVEEALPPDQLHAFSQLRLRINTPLAAGEHEATRFGFHQLLNTGAFDVIQPDANRMGGITEAKRVWALGETYGVDVITHLGATHNLHLSFASASTPLIEWMPAQDVGFDEDQLFWNLFNSTVTCTNGIVSLPDGPGLGVTLNEALIDTSFDRQLTTSSGAA